MWCGIFVHGLKEDFAVFPLKEVLKIYKVGQKMKTFLIQEKRMIGELGGPQ